MKYKIKSIFGPTLQGEGSLTGTVVKFVRFSGCNKWSGREEDRATSVCPFCDTDFRGGESLEAWEVVQRLEQLSPTVKKVVLTGGEPTLQLKKEFLQTLKTHGYETLLETNGSQSIKAYEELLDHVTVSPKQKRGETKLEWATDLKLLYPPPADGVTVEEFETFPTVFKFLQPITNRDGTWTVKETLQKLYEKPNWRLSLQTHKLIGVE